MKRKLFSEISEGLEVLGLERRGTERLQKISLRLPVYLLERIKLEANERDVPHQALIQAWLSEKVSSIHLALLGEAVRGLEEVRDGRVASAGHVLPKHKVKRRR